MPDTYNYPAEIERDEDGRYVVAFPDFGWGATDGATREEALAEAGICFASCSRRPCARAMICPSRRAQPRAGPSSSHRCRLR